MTWKRVVFASDCSECSLCGEPVCEECNEHYADCECPGPDLDDHEYLYKPDGSMWARPKIDEDE